MPAKQRLANDTPNAVVGLHEWLVMLIQNPHEDIRRALFVLQNALADTKFANPSHAAVVADAQDLVVRHGRIYSHAPVDALETLEGQEHMAKLRAMEVRMRMNFGPKRRRAHQAEETIDVAAPPQRGPVELHPLTDDGPLPETFETPDDVIEYLHRALEELNPSATPDFDALSELQKITLFPPDSIRTSKRQLERWNSTQEALQGAIKAVANDGHEPGRPFARKSTRVAVQLFETTLREMAEAFGVKPRWLFDGTFGRPIENMSPRRRMVDVANPAATRQRAGKGEMPIILQKLVFTARAMFESRGSKQLAAAAAETLREARRAGLIGTDPVKRELATVIERWGAGSRASHLVSSGLDCIIHLESRYVPTRTQADALKASDIDASQLKPDAHLVRVLRAVGAELKKNHPDMDFLADIGDALPQPSAFFETVPAATRTRYTAARSALWAAAAAVQDDIDGRGSAGVERTHSVRAFMSSVDALGSAISGPGLSL